ncbi:GntP family gluconate:H+ symporter [Methanolinea mesophila]|uniref:GntP family permease n=1 Tax=Methanolinea mesophila TaxID=547055 RepID=UPI001AE97082|nr:GntP family permease [Methanolinea mesophila]MBP1929222.1 GntP family gluconate:H+ symporter [Methanolinea mesophila]
MLVPLFVSFAITLAFITVIGIRYRISPFFSLIGGAILFGLLAGMSPEQVFQGIITGLGSIFAIFGIIILSGAIIARLLVEQHQTEEIVSDIRKRIRNPVLLSGFAGYILSVPVTCCITAFVMLQPILGHIGETKEQKNRLLYIAALGSVISYALIYPTPVVIPLYNAFSGTLSPLVLDAVTIPVSLLILGVLIVLFMRKGKIFPGNEGDRDHCTDAADTNPACRTTGFHIRAWAPFIVIILALPPGVYLLGLTHTSLIQFIMLAGVVCAILIADPQVRKSAISKGTGHAGLIIFDICGAGALGAIIVQSGFAQQAMEQISGIFPLLMVPFLIAALIQTAQGSRVVTAVITAGILSGTTLPAAVNPISLILMVAAGSCLVSFVTDPFFWLIHRTTGDDIPTVTRSYTIPLALAGIGLFLVALVIQGITIP